MLTEPVTPGRYRTRCGRTAVVLCNDAPGDWPCVGYFYRDAVDRLEWSSPESWTRLGRAQHDAVEGDDDLIKRIGDLP